MIANFVMSNQLAIDAALKLVAFKNFITEKINRPSTLEFDEQLVIV